MDSASPFKQKTCILHTLAGLFLQPLWAKKCSCTR